MDAKRLTLLAAVLGSFVALLDSTVVNVALPAIRDDLGGGPRGPAVGGQRVPALPRLAHPDRRVARRRLRREADLHHRRRRLRRGVRPVCAAAPSIEVLVAGRALQGVFGALLTPASLALIVATFPPAERGAAIGTWTAYTGIAAVVGPLVGGWLVDTLSWRWIFAINVPFVMATLAITLRVPTPVRDGVARHPDWVGAALCAVGLAGPTFGLVRQPESGWTAPDVLLPIVVGLAVFALFLAWERRRRDPMLPLGLFGRGNFAWGNVETFAMYAGLGVMFFLLVLFLQQVAGYSALEAGLATLPTTLVMFACRGASARSPIAPARGCSWAPARSSRRSGCCCSSCSSTRARASSRRCCRASSSSRSACR
jgi:MFS family permease